MKDTDPRIDAYIGKAASFAKPILKHLRKMVRKACPGVEETMKWSMPSFLYGGRILCGMAAFKKHCGFWFWHRGMSAVLRADGRKSAPAMGSFGRVTSLKDLPSDKKMALYIKKAAALNESDAPARQRPKKRSAPPLAVPEDLERSAACGALAYRRKRRHAGGHAGHGPQEELGISPRRREPGRGAP